MDPTDLHPSPEVAAPGRPLTSAEIGVLAHVFRGELYRSTLWRTRLDTTTNWSVVTLGIALSISFASPDASAVPLLLVGVLIVFFLMLEARRYRYFNVWRARCRWLETHMIAPMLEGDELRVGPGWTHALAEDYRHPSYHVSLWVAVGRRIRRNYLWILLIQSLAWLAKIAVHPAPLVDAGQLVERAAVGPIPGAAVMGIGALYVGSWLALALWSRARDRRGAAQRRGQSGMG